jgi:hypothetical protein
MDSVVSCWLLQQPTTSLTSLVHVVRMYMHRIQVGGCELNPACSLSEASLCSPPAPYLQPICSPSVGDLQVICNLTEAYLQPTCSLSATYLQL